jgi:hypothetical protein
MSNYVMNAERMKKEGKKFDSEKPMMQLLPSKALVEVSKVLSFGANKYGKENYSHLAHAVCGLLFKLEIELEKDKEERLRESISAEHRESDSTVKPEFFGKTYNKETSV